MTEPHRPASATCDNCATVLQGGYCHVCGQRAHSPLQHVGHAIEEVFESFWHLDGRIFSTLRDLFVPGRVAAGYLAGHRVRYVAPLRLFIVLSLVTFFVGKLTLHIDAGDAVQINMDPPKNGVVVGDTRVDDSDFRHAKTPEAVLAIRNNALRGIAAENADAKTGPVLTALLDFAKRQIDVKARARMVELGATPAQLRMLDAPVAAPADAAVDAKPAASTPAPAPASSAPSPGAVAAGKQEDSGFLQRWFELGATPAQLRMLDAPVAAPADAAVDAKPAASTPAPAPASSAPSPGAVAAGKQEDSGFLQRWFEHKVEKIRENAEIVQKNPDELLKRFLGAVPGALFLLMPVFALCLKLLYIRSGRGYLEHLVVSLYSHAFMLVGLLVAFLLIGLRAVPGLPALAGGVSALAASLTLFLLVPLYLLWMQKRVYAQSWVKTLAKYVTLGVMYSLLLCMAILYAVLAGLSS